MKRIAAVILALSFLAAGCTKSGGGGTNAVSGTRVNNWTIPHVLRMTLAAEDVKNLNPLVNTDTSVSLIIAPLTMGYLVRYDQQDRPVPELITQIPTQSNGGVSKDGLTITYHIRKGVKWSDGAPFDADDVIFSFHAVLNPANNVPSRTGWDQITSMDEPDKYTIVLHLKKQYSPFVETFFSTSGANPAVLPRHLLAKYPNLNNVPYNSNPVGIGPFKIKEWLRAQRVVLVANPLYWRGTPKLKEIDYEIIPDANTLITQMQARNLDLSYQTPPSQYPQAKALSDFVTWPQPSYYFRHVDFNLTSPKLKDPAVRMALKYAIDRPTIISKLYHGLAVLQDQPAPKISVYWDPGVDQAPFDIAKANEILDRAGWKRDSDGVREKNGARLDLNFATASGTVINDELIEMLRQTWKQIGVKISVSHYENNLLFAPYQEGGILYNGKFDVAYFAWGLDGIGDMSPVYSCDNIPPNGQNIMHWCNPAADKAMHDFYTHYSQAQRNADDAVVFREIAKDVPTVVLMGTQALWIYNKDLKNFHPGALSPFDNFMDVDI